MKGGGGWDQAGDQELNWDGSSGKSEKLSQEQQKSNFKTL